MSGVILIIGVLFLVGGGVFEKKSTGLNPHAYSEEENPLIESELKN